MTFPSRSLSVKAKAALVTTAGVLLLFALFAFIEVQRVRDSMRSVLGAQQLTLIAPLADELDDKIRASHRALIVSAATLPPEALADLAGLERSLLAQPALASLFDDLNVIGRDGRVLIDLPALRRRGIDVSGRDFFRRTLATRKPVISEPYVGTLGQATVMMTAPILDRDGQVRAMLTGALHPLNTNFLGRLRGAQVGVSGRFALLARDRTIIISLTAGQVMVPGPAPGVSAVFDHAMAGRAGWEEAVNGRGLRALYSYQPLAAVPWVLVAALPVAEAYAPIAAAQREALGVAGLLALLLAPLVWLGMQYVLAPIGLLRDAIRRIRGNPEGEDLVRMPHRDELGDLADDFNAMVRERRSASALLRASEDRYRSLTELSADWYWEQDAEFRFTSFAGTEPGIEGQSRSASALGKRPWEAEHINMSAAQWDAHRAALAAHESFRDFEVCRPDAAGRPAYALISGAPVFDAAGRFSGYRGVGRDVTHVRAAEREAAFRQRIESILLVMSSRFLNAGAGAIDGIILDSLREIGEFAEADRCFINLLDDDGAHYSLAYEWCGPGVPSKSGIRQHIPVAQAGPLWERVSHNEVARVYVGELAPGGRERAMYEAASIRSSCGVPVVSAGRLLGCLAFDAVRAERHWDDNLVVLMRIASDVLGGIIAQRRAAAALRASEEKFAKAFRSSPTFMCIATVAEGRYVEANEAFLRDTGHSREEVIGHSSQELGLWKHQADRLRLIEAIRRDGRVSAAEAELCKKSGATMICEIWGEPLEIEGEQCIVWLTNDITERKRAQAQVVQLNASLEQRVAERTAELQQANRELESFSYTISHDLRAPLRSIAGFSGLLAESLGGKLAGEERRYLERIVASATRMSQLIDEVLEYSRIARSALMRRPVDLDVLVREVAEDLREQYPRASIEIQPLGRANADPTMLRQVFHNLIGNALKYSATRAAPRVEIGAAPGAVRDGMEGVVEYYVSDNGVGFDMRHADHLFTLFTRLHSDPNFEGIGAGLAIVKRLIDRHHGRISAHAEPDQGATFRFSIQAGAQPAPDPASGASAVSAEAELRNAGEGH